jgi:hypothetical protein
LNPIPMSPEHSQMLSRPASCARKAKFPQTTRAPQSAFSVGKSRCFRDARRACSLALGASTVSLGFRFPGPTPSLAGTAFTSDKPTTRISDTAREGSRKPPRVSGTRTAGRAPVGVHRSKLEEGRMASKRKRAKKRDPNEITATVRSKG